MARSALSLAKFPVVMLGVIGWSEVNRLKSKSAVTNSWGTPAWFGDILDKENSYGKMSVFQIRFKWKVIVWGKNGFEFEQKAFMPHSVKCLCHIEKSTMQISIYFFECRIF